MGPLLGSCWSRRDHFLIIVWSCRGHFFMILGMCWNVFGSTVGMLLVGFGRVWGKSVDDVVKNVFVFKNVSK